MEVFILGLAGPTALIVLAFRQEKIMRINLTKSSSIPPPNELKGDCTNVIVKRLHVVENILSQLIHNFSRIIERLLNMENLINNSPPPNEIMKQLGLTEPDKEIIETTAQNEKICRIAVQQISESNQESGNKYFSIDSSVYQVFWSTHPHEEVSPEIVRNLSDSWAKAAPDGKMINVVGIMLKPGWQTMLGIFEYKMYTMEEIISLSKKEDGQEN